MTPRQLPNLTPLKNCGQETKPPSPPSLPLCCDHRPTSPRAYNAPPSCGSTVQFAPHPSASTVTIDSLSRKWSVTGMINASSSDSSDTSMVKKPSWRRNSIANVSVSIGGDRASRRQSQAVAAATARTRKLALHLSAFVLIFVVTWSMDVVLVILLNVKTYAPFWVMVLDVVLTNMAGVWNALAYRSMITAIGPTSR